MSPEEQDEITVRHFSRVYERDRARALSLLRRLKRVARRASTFDRVREAFIANNNAWMTVEEMVEEGDATIHGVRHMLYHSHSHLFDRKPRHDGRFAGFRLTRRIAPRSST